MRVVAVVVARASRPCGTLQRLIMTKEVRCKLNSGVSWVSKVMEAAAPVIKEDPLSLLRVKNLWQIWRQSLNDRAPFSYQGVLEAKVESDLVIQAHSINIAAPCRSLSCMVAFRLWLATETVLFSFLQYVLSE